MRGAVMFGHRHMQPVIESIIQLAEKAAKEPRDFAQPDTKAVEKEMLRILEGDLREAHGERRRSSADSQKPLCARPRRSRPSISARTRSPRSRRRRCALLPGR